MLFHLGVLWRLNDFGYFPKLDRISSVSGGSITAGVLGLAWKDLAFDATGVATAFGERVVGPVRRLADRTIDVSAVIFRAVGLWRLSDRVVAAYRKHLFGHATLQELPQDPPRFVINATNLQSGVLWRFSRPYMRDYRVGEVQSPKVELALAVAASSAFPPFLSPVVLKLQPNDFTPNSGDDLQHGRFVKRAVLSDGGVYDNLGLETAWKKRIKTVLVSNAGGQMEAKPKVRANWPLQSYRVLNVIDNQVRSLRKRNTIHGYVTDEHAGAYWGIRINIADYQLPDALPCPFDRTSELAQTKTRLKKLRPLIQERLINWGYAAADAGMRRYVYPSLPAPEGFPYPAAKV